MGSSALAAGWEGAGAEKENAGGMVEPEEPEAALLEAGLACRSLPLSRAGSRAPPREGALVLGSPRLLLRRPRVAWEVEEDPPATNHGMAWHGRCKRAHTYR